MENQHTLGPTDDPFEWLGNGVLMDQRNENNPTNSPCEEHNPVSDLNKGNNAMNNIEVGKPNEPDLYDDPFAMLGRELLMDQNGLNQQQPMNNVTGLVNDPVSEPPKSNEILVEDVCSVDENQLDTSEGPESDRSYVVQELFPSVAPSASHRSSTGVPATIYEEDTSRGVGKTDNSSQLQQQHQQEFTSIYGPAEYTSNGEIVQNQENLLQQNQQVAVNNGAAESTHQVNQAKTSISECNDQLKTDRDNDRDQEQEASLKDLSDDFLLSFNEPPNVLGAAPSVPNISSAASGNQNSSLQPDPIQFPINSIGLSEPTNEKFQSPQIQNSTSALNFPGSLYEVPLGYVASQHATSPLANHSTMGNQSSTSQLENLRTPDGRNFETPSAAASQSPRPDSELRFSGSLFAEPMGLPTPTQNAMNYGRALSNPSAACTITTAGSTNIEYDSDSDESRGLFRHDVPKHTFQRRSLVETYGLFNNDTNDTKPSAQQNHVARNFSTDDSSVEGSADCKGTVVSAKKNRKAPSFSKNNPVKTSLVVPDEEGAIAPGMVGYTGFDEDDDESCNNPKKSGPKASYKKLRQIALADAKPKSKKFLIVSGIVFALLVIVSVLLSMVVNNKAKTATNFNDASGVESSEGSTVDIEMSNGTNTVDESEISATVSSPIETDATSSVANDTMAPSSLPSTSYPTASSASYSPFISLVETENVSAFPTYSDPTYTPSVSPVIVTETPSVEPTHEDDPTFHPTSSGSSAPPSNYNNQTETTAPSVVPTSIAPTDISSSPSISASTNPTLSDCKGSIAANNISESIALFSDHEPCADFYVDICMDEFDSETLTEWAIVYFSLPDDTGSDESSPSPSPYSTLGPNFDDWYDDNLYDDAYLDDDDLSFPSTRNVKEDELNKNASQHITFYDQGAYFSDQFTGTESAIVCLPKGTYQFTILQTSNAFALYFGNGRPVRPMSTSNYTDEIDAISFGVTAFDILGTGANLTSVPVTISQSNVSSNQDDDFADLITSSGNDLIDDISKAFGILFDIEVGQKPLTINSMELYLDTSFPAHYEIHTKEGGWKNNEALTGFRQVSHGNIVGGGVCQNPNNCTFARIPREDFEPVSLPSRARQSFYVTLTTEDLVYQHYLKDGEKIAYVDIVQASGPELTVFLGASVLAYPLELADPTTDFRSGGFIGRLIYEVDGEEVVPPPFIDDIFVYDEPDPMLQSVDECYYYTEASCRKAAIELGLSIGGSGFPFSGYFHQSGCYFYPCESCLFGGRAYFGKSSDKRAMESTESLRLERRLDCRTNVDNLRLDTNFWCLFPSDICSAPC